jgi:hypothetical protein
VIQKSVEPASDLSEAAGLARDKAEGLLKSIATDSSAEEIKPKLDEAKGLEETVNEVSRNVLSLSEDANSKLKVL